MKKSIFYLIPTAVCLVFIIILTVFFGTKKETKLLPFENGDNLYCFLEEENKNAVVFASSKNSKNAFSDFTSSLNKSGADVYSVFLKPNEQENSQKLKETFELLQKEKQYEKIAFVGYDVGGFEGLRFLNNNSQNLDSAVFLAPGFESYNEKDLSIKDGSYVLNVPWVMELKKENFTFPILILSSISDEYCTPQLAALIYNHLSGDDIQRSVSTFGAKRENISLLVETGTFHSFVPFSEKMLEKTLNFLSTDGKMDLNITKIGNNFKPLLWALSGISLIVALSFLNYGACKKFTDVTQTLFGSNTKNTVILFAQRVLSMLISAVVVFAFYFALKNSTIFDLSFFISLFFFVSAILSLVSIRLFVLPKGASLLKSMKMLSKSKNRHLSLLVFALCLFAYFSLILTGYTYNALSLRNLPIIILVFLMSVVGVLDFCYEIELLRILTKTRFLVIAYGLIHLIPFVLILAYSFIETSFALSFKSAFLAIIYAVSVLTALTMREIGAERFSYVTLSGAFLTLCLVTLI